MSIPSSNRRNETEGINSCRTPPPYEEFFQSKSFFHQQSTSGCAGGKSQRLPRRVERHRAQWRRTVPSIRRCRLIALSSAKCSEPRVRKNIDAQGWRLSKKQGSSTRHKTRLAAGWGFASEAVVRPHGATICACWKKQLPRWTLVRYGLLPPTHVCVYIYRHIRQALRLCMISSTCNLGNAPAISESSMLQR